MSVQAFCLNLIPLSITFLHPLIKKKTKSPSSSYFKCLLRCFICPAILLFYYYCSSLQRVPVSNISLCILPTSNADPRRKKKNIYIYIYIYFKLVFFFFFLKKPFKPFYFFLLNVNFENLIVESDILIIFSIYGCKISRKSNINSYIINDIFKLSK